jgi:hypothetical protein
MPLLMRSTLLLFQKHLVANLLRQLNRNDAITALLTAPHSPDSRKPIFEMVAAFFRAGSRLAFWAEDY